MCRSGAVAFEFLRSSNGLAELEHGAERQTQRQRVRRRAELHARRHLGGAVHRHAEPVLLIECDGERRDRAEQHAESAVRDRDRILRLGPQRRAAGSDVVDGEHEIVVAIGYQRAGVVGEHALVTHGLGNLREHWNGEEHCQERERNDSFHGRPPLRGCAVAVSCPATRSLAEVTLITQRISACAPPGA